MSFNIMKIIKKVTFKRKYVYWRTMIRDIYESGMSGTHLAFMIRYRIHRDRLSFSTMRRVLVFSTFHI